MRSEYYIYALEIKELKSKQSLGCASLFSYYSKSGQALKFGGVAAMGAAATATTALCVMTCGGGIVCLECCGRLTAATWGLTARMATAGFGHTFTSENLIPFRGLHLVEKNRGPQPQQMDDKDAKVVLPSNVIYVVDGRSPAALREEGGIKYNHEDGGQGVCFFELADAEAFVANGCCWNPEGHFDAARGWNVRETWEAYDARNPAQPLQERLLVQ